MVKSKVLQILELNKGNVISGSDMAKIAGASRNAVWKAVKSLVADGYNIVANKGGGYILDELSNQISVEGIKAHLINDSQVFVFDEVGSTNDICKKMTSENADKVIVVVANRQSDGRGRRGRSFFSPADEGIYMSVALPLKISPGDSSLITTASAVAVSDAIDRTTGKNTKIKWINDIYLNEKKCAGILTEGIFNLDEPEKCTIVVGIGINVTTATFPEEIINTATTIGAVSRNELIANIVDNLVKITQNIKKRAHFMRYNEKCFVLGRKITVIKQDETFVAKAKFVDTDGRLIVETNDGKEIVLYNEEVSTVVNNDEH